MSGGGLALASLVLAVGVWAFWWRRIQRVDVPLRPWRHWIALGASAALAVAAFATGPGWLGGAAAGLALAMAGLFFFITWISGLPTPSMQVAVGQPAPDFTTLDSSGATFSLSSLRGRPVLLKFFRGHW